MQTLWSRVARGSCRCPQCLSTAHGVSRKTTASATRRMPKYITSSTLWYSGIFAAAATFDAGIKNQRREQWNLAIAEMKEELAVPDLAAQDQRVEVLQVGQIVEQDSSATYKPFDGLLDDQDIWRNVDPRRPKSKWPANTGPAPDHDHLPPESIYAPDYRKARSTQTQYTPKKLATVQMAVEMLQLKIFLELREKGWSDEAAKAVPDDFATKLLLSTKELQREYDFRRTHWIHNLSKADPELSDYQPILSDVRLCNYKQEGIHDSARAIEHLNASLRELFELHTKRKSTLPALLAQVSYHLSLSPAPPKLSTFNTLLLGLSRSQQPTLVDAVIAATRLSKMRYNEVSLVAILGHFTRTNQSDKFVHWIELMRGKHNGLVLARPDITITDAGKSRLIPQEDDPTKIMQLPYPTPNVFSAIISGVIKFADFEAALSICERMGGEGWGLCMSGLTPLLQDCERRGDWKSGLAVWSQIQALKASSRQKQGRSWTYETIHLVTYAAMLRLCSKCDKRDYFDQVWAQASRAHQQAGEKLVQMIKAESNVMPECRTLEAAAEPDYILNDPTSSGVNMVSQAKEDLPDLRELDRSPSADYRLQSQAVSTVLDELKPTRRRNITEDRRILNGSQGWNLGTISTELSSTLPLSNPAARPRSSTTFKSQELHEGQLHGYQPFGDALDEYELSERPMSLSC